MSYLIGTIQSAVVNLNAGDVGNLYSSPKLVVPSPGSGFLLMPITCYIQFFPGSHKFGTSGSLVMGYGTTPITVVSNQDNVDIDPTYNIFSEPPYNNGFTSMFDTVKKGDSAWHNVSLTLSQVATSPVFTLTAASNPVSTQGEVTYTGTITGGTGNAFEFYTFTITGFTNSANNGTFLCTSSSSSTLVLQNANGVAETHAGSAAAQTTLYTGTITNPAEFTPGTPNQRTASFTVAGFTNSANNGTFKLVGNPTSTTILLNNPAAVSETHAATASYSAFNQPLVVMMSDGFPNPKDVGAVLTAKIMAGNSGSGYSPGDTGSIDDGGSGTLATYTVNTIDGGTGIATFTLNTGGNNSQGANGYQLNFGYNDTNQSGAGTGAIFVPQTVQAGNGIARMVVTYTVLPI